jgi:bifunctional DNase/RNase
LSIAGCQIGSSTSDAIALAIWQKCGIFIRQKLLAKMGVDEPAEGRIYPDKRGANGTIQIKRTV